jgi:hypothetical protein
VPSDHLNDLRHIAAQLGDHFSLPVCIITSHQRLCFGGLEQTRDLMSFSGLSVGLRGQVDNKLSGLFRSGRGGIMYHHTRVIGL